MSVVGIFEECCNRIVSQVWDAFRLEQCCGCAYPALMLLQLLQDHGIGSLGDQELFDPGL